jgi:copper transport protein
MRLSFLILVAASAVAFASRPKVHASLVSSEPAAKSHLATAPARIRLVFSEPIEGKLSRITLVRSGGTPFVVPAAGDPRDVHAVIAPSDSLTPGAYRLEWRIVSADGHPVDGTFAFAIGDTTLGAQTPPPPAAIPADTQPTPEAQAEEMDTDFGPTIAGAPLIPGLLRGLGLGALMATGGLLFFLLIAPAGAAQRGCPRLRAITSRFAIASTVLIIGHLAAWLIHTSPDQTLTTEWAASALGTSVGKIELWRTGLAVLALWAVGLARRYGLALALVIAALAVSGAIGHPAAMQPYIAVPAKANHLLASSVWLGGLLWLVIRPTKDTPDLFRDDTARVSTLALGAVIAVALTGVLQTWLFLPKIGDVLTSPYGWFALAKTAGLLALAGFGAYHRKRLIPQLAAVAQGGEVTMRTWVAREIWVMLVVILLGGMLAYVPPPGEGDEASMSNHGSSTS